ncbi:MAG: hypothetical protein K2L86_15780 [Lachnospiraceae bacterium]|nr:hypothetical protein [Lachnospiraceae bacterium]
MEHSLGAFFIRKISRTHSGLPHVHLGEVPPQYFSETVLRLAKATALSTKTRLYSN